MCSKVELKGCPLKGIVKKLLQVSTEVLVSGKGSFMHNGLRVDCWRDEDHFIKGYIFDEDVPGERKFFRFRQAKGSPTLFGIMCYYGHVEEKNLKGEWEKKTSDVMF
jgi:hypothetical protein